MDETIALHFQYDGSPIKVRSFSAAAGIAFDKPRDVSPLGLAVGLRALQPARLEPVRRRHDWRNNEFLLDARAEGGALVLSGHAGDRDGLPPGGYDLSVEVKSYRFANARQRILLDRGGRADIVLNAERDKRAVRLLDNVDRETASLLGRSAVDDVSAIEWLGSDGPREARKACLLNILCKLAAQPMTNPPVRSLTPRFSSLFFADVDRVYGAADPQLHADLKDFAARKGWAREGSPKSAIHRKVADSAIAQFPKELGGVRAEQFELESFRQGGRNCLQIVIAKPTFSHDKVYADLDIDLGNPLWDVEGFVVHMGELLDDGRTDHFSLRSKLRRGNTSDFVFYEIVEPGSGAAAGGR